MRAMAETRQGATLDITSRQTPAPPMPAPARADNPPAEGLSGPQQRILDALAWLASLGSAVADRPRIAWLADASPNSSGFQNNLGSLSTRGLVRYPYPGKVELTVEGRAAANKPDRPPTNAALHASIEAKLPGPQWAIVSELIAAYPNPLGRETLATQCGVSANSSGYQNNLGALRSLGLIDYPVKGQVVALPILFVE